MDLLGFHTAPPTLYNPTVSSRMTLKARDPDSWIGAKPVIPMGVVALSQGVEDAAGSRISYVAMDLSKSQQDVSPASSWLSLAMKELL